jgi:hypothetical protein
MVLPIFNKNILRIVFHLVLTSWTALKKTL